MMIKIPLYIPEPLPGTELAPWFAPKRAGVFNEKVVADFFTTSVERISVEKAKAIVLPHNFKDVTPESQAYIAAYAEMGQKHHVPVLVFSMGDFTDRIQFDPRVYVLRLSLYGHTKTPRDISMPTLTEDLGAGGITLRSKGERPVVSFCGQAGYQTRIQRVKYYIKVVLGLAASAFKPSLRAKLIGVYWRRKVLSACRRSSLLETLFILRNSFSGARRTIELDATQARSEFVESINNADFVLAPKGDGNYSNRFLEALSMGRIPVLLDTDMVLTLEENIDYAKVVVRVPMNRVKDTAKYVREFYDSLTEEEWQARQKLAREMFERYLRNDSFFDYFFTEVVPGFKV